MPNSRVRARRDTSKWFMTAQPMSVSELVAALRRAPHTKRLLSRTAREWLLHRGLKPLPAVRRRPGLRRARGPRSVEILDTLWPLRQGRLADFLDQLAQAWCVTDRDPRHPNESPSNSQPPSGVYPQPSSSFNELRLYNERVVTYL
jgi:hypothetical protein